jgi:hypothetical protein
MLQIRAHARIRSPVDHVSEHDKTILGLGFDCLDGRLQAGGTTVDVTNREGSVGNGVILLHSVRNHLIVGSVRSLIDEGSARGPVAEFLFGLL